MARPCCYGRRCAASPTARPRRAPDIAGLFWWASQSATSSVAHALHTFGGYGLTNEYDLQLYHRRAKAWALTLGDPRQELIRAGRRLYLGEATSLPDVGAGRYRFRAARRAGRSWPRRPRAVSSRSSTPQAPRCTSRISNRMTGKCTAPWARPGCSIPTGRKNGAAAAPMPTPPAPACGVA